MRTLVAVGTARLASMLATIRDAAPRRTVASSLAGSPPRRPEPGRRLPRRRPPGLPGCRCGGLRGRDGGRAVVGEELPPAVADRVGVGQEPVVHVVDQPRIGAEGASRAAELGHGPTLPAAVGSGGRPVASALPMSYPAALHCHRAAGAAPEASRHGGVRPRVARPGRELPAGHAPAARGRPRWPTTAGATRAPGAAGWSDLGGHIDDLLARGGRGAQVRDAAAPSSPSGHSLGGDVVVGAALADPAGLRRHRGLRAAHALARVPPRPAPEARRPGPPWPRTPATRPSGSSRRMVGPAAWDRLTDEGRAAPAGRRPGAGGRPAQLPRRGPAVRRDRAGRAGGVRHGRAGDAAAPPPQRARGWRPTCPGPTSTRSRGPSTAPTSRTRTTSPR